MVLPLYLALTAAEISSLESLPVPMAYMGCSFSPYSLGLSGIPSSLPEGCMLIVNDRMSCQGHSPDLVAGQLQEAVTRLSCESVLLDFQRPLDSESKSMVAQIIQSLFCPVAVTEGFASDLDCPVFLSPAPLHIPLADHLAPWQGREIWMEAALEQADVRITSDGVTSTSQFPAEALTGGFYEKELCCCYHTKIDADCINFTLFDTFESLENKLDLAASLGVTRAVGLWQELRAFPTGMQPA